MCASHKHNTPQITEKQTSLVRSLLLACVCVYVASRSTSSQAVLQLAATNLNRTDVNCHQQRASESEPRDFGLGTAAGL